MSIAENRKAHFNYFLEDRFEAGIVLEGWEVKSIRSGQVQLTSAAGSHNRCPASAVPASASQRPPSQVSAMQTHSPKRLPSSTHVAAPCPPSHSQSTVDPGSQTFGASTSRGGVQAHRTARLRKTAEECFMTESERE